MVVFVCNHCGESVKKTIVEKHFNTRCRGAPVNVSCMDCLKDFHGEAYVAHTKCITETEKYSAKDYVAKENKNSGAKKQESWMDIIRSILETSEYKLSEQARAEFQRLQTMDNVPRKKAKFQNYVHKCLRMHQKPAEEVWNVLEKELEKMKKAKHEQTEAAKAAQNTAKTVKDKPVDATNGTVTPSENGNKSKNKETKAAKRDAAACNGAESPPATKKAKKQKTEIVEQVVTEAVIETENGVEEFAWSDALKKIVVKHAEGIALEKLKKKLLKKYSAKLGLTNELTEKQQKKFEKKFSKNLKKCIELQLTENVVRCC